VNPFLAILLQAVANGAVAALQAFVLHLQQNAPPK